MTSALKWFAVYLSRGVVKNVVQVAGVGSDENDVYYVKALDKKQAQKDAYNLYCAQKKKTAIARLETEGKCRCGRLNPDIEEFKTCPICRLRAANNKTRTKEKHMTGQPVVRDETARVEQNLTRQRDRKNEIRLEVLVEVQKAWQNNRTAGGFTRWLDREVEQCLKPRAVTAE